MKLLITGGAGFIGSHLCDRAIKQGDSVIALDDLSSGSEKNLSQIADNPNFQFVRGSILNESLVSELVRSVDGVMHFAAAVGVQKILDDPRGSLITNIHGTENILGNAARYKKKSILASSSEIYGKNSLMPLTEESDRVLGSPLMERWSYSESKAIDETYARSLFKENNFEVQIVRLFNTVGPRQSPAYGMVIPRFFEAALENKPLFIHGDGTQRRVFGHIEDAVDAIFALWNSDEGYGEAFNVGGIEETTINDLARRIIELTNSKSEILFQSYDELAKLGFEDFNRRVPSTEKISRLTSWRPQKNLQDILEETLKSYRES